MLFDKAKRRVTYRQSFSTTYVHTTLQYPLEILHTGLTFLILRGLKNFDMDRETHEENEFCLTFFLPVFEVPILSEIGLHLFIGPSCANLSLLRLLLLINIVSLSKVSNYLSSGLSFGLHLSLGPCFGLLRWTTSVLTDSEGQKGHFLAAATFEGLETFWDLGCCLLYFCLWLLIKVHQIPKKKAKNSRIR